MRDLWDSAVILGTIFSFIFFTAIICWFLYQGKYASVVGSFGSITESFYSILILLTTANFPDIMLPQYNETWWNCLPILAFLLIGLYFLANVLLANVYNKYEKRLVSEDKEIVKMMEEHLVDMLDRITGGKHVFHLDAEQTTRFFVEVMDLDIENKRYDYNTFQRILLEMRPRDPKNITKREFLNFFLLDDGYDRLSELQKKNKNEEIK